MNILKFGDIGTQVQQLQQYLNDAGLSCDINGLYEDHTLNEVKIFQHTNSLIVDGIYGYQTRLILTGAYPELISRFLTVYDVINGAKKLNISIPSLLAVIEIERTDVGLNLPDLQPAVIFHRDIFFKQLSLEIGSDAAESIALLYPSLCNTKSGGYIGGESEFHRLQQAINIHSIAAIKSAQFGAFKLCGDQYELCGYKSAQEFYNAMCESESAQFQAFIQYLLADEAMRGCLKSKDWEGYAKLRFGVSYINSDYDLKLAAAYRRYSQDYQTQDQYEDAVATKVEKVEITAKDTKAANK